MIVLDDLHITSNDSISDILDGYFVCGGLSKAVHGKAMLALLKR